MKVVIQKVLNANVKVNGKIVGEVERGLVVFVAFTDGDDIEKIKYMVNKIINLRIFEDKNGIMNLSVTDINGKILSISQFTLYGDCTKGHRPSYVKALTKNKAEELYNLFNENLNKNIITSTGIFHENMKVSLENDGPTTIIIEK